MEEKRVNSLEEAIKVTATNLGYKTDNAHIIRKLISNALESANNFTPTNGARDYVLSLNRDGVLRELFMETQINTENLDELIEAYINKCFKIKDGISEIENIHQNSDLDKIAKRIRFINTTSENDYDFNIKLWDYFTRAFTGEEKYLGTKELIYDMLEAALQKANLIRDHARILKKVNINSKDMTEMDAVTLVEDYVYKGKKNQLWEGIYTNQVLSGLLLQNLFDYTYFKKEDKKIRHFELDYQLAGISNLNIKANVLNQILSGDKIAQINISREEALVEVFINTLALNIYKNNKSIVDLDEQNLYTGGEEISKEILEKRITVTEQLANSLLTNGMDTTIEDIATRLNNLTSNDIIFLANIYCKSRYSSENRNKLDNSIYYGTREQTHIYNLLVDPKLKEILKEPESKKVA